MAIQLKQNERIQMWRTLFPNTENLCKKEVESQLFMKRLTGIAVSTVLYLRKILPAENFEKLSVDDTTVRILKSAPHYKHNTLVKSWLAGAFEAIDKKYLKSMILEVQDGRTNEAVESYVFRFGYNDSDIVSSLYLSSPNPLEDIFGKSQKVTFTSVQSKTTELLQMCHALTASKAALPNDLTLTMRLLYYEDTPKHYQPSGFEECEVDIPNFMTKPRKTELGRVETNHHFLKIIRLACVEEKDAENEKQEDRLIRDNQDRRDEFIFEGELVVPHQNSLDKILGAEANELPTTEHNLLPPSRRSKHRAKKAKVMNEDESSSEARVVRTSTPVTEEVVRCVCQSVLKTSIMFQCSTCNCWFHAECYGFLDSIDLKLLRGREFYCINCDGKTTAGICHDKKLSCLDEKDRQNLAVLRRVLNYCNRQRTRSFYLKTINKITGLEDENLIKTVMERLLDLEVIKYSQKGYVIRKGNLSDILPRFFYPIHGAPSSSLEED